MNVITPLLRGKHSKTKNLNNYGLQTYLTSQDLSVREERLLFSLRSRMFHVKTNYNKYRPCTIPGHSLHFLYHSNAERVFSEDKIKITYYNIIIIIYIYLNFPAIQLIYIQPIYSLFHIIIHRWRCSLHITIQVIMHI